MITLPMGPVYVWIMIFLRAGFVLAFFPLFGEGFVPLRIRIVLAAVLALALTPVSPVSPGLFPTTMGGFAELAFTEALLGFGLGMIGKVLFAIVQFSGQLAGEQMGFGIVNAIDPTGSHQIAVVAEMCYVLSILVFLTANLHHVFLATLAGSYRVLPPGAASFNGGVVEFMMRLGALLFQMALRLAMPVIIIIFVINVALGMIARGVPQVNVFFESFPLRIIAGVSVMMVALGFTVSLWGRLFGDMGGMMAELVGLMAR